MALAGSDRAISISPATRGADALAAVQHGARCRLGPLTRVMYARALNDFFGWWTGQGRPPFTRATVQAWRAALEAKGLAPASVNQKLSAIRKLAAEAAYNGLLDPAAAQAIRDIRGAEQRGVRPGNWLTKRQAEALLAAPDAATNQGKRDRAILAVLVGCGLRRDEAVRLTFAHIQQRDGRWCVVDLVGKKGRYRTVPMPAWTKTAIDSWAAAAGITAGAVFRGVTKGDVVIGERLSTQGILRAVTCYAEAVAPHDLRRTFAKLAFKGGAKLDQIQLSLGHASIQTTETVSGGGAGSDGRALRLPAPEGRVNADPADNRKYYDARWRKFRLGMLEAAGNVCQRCGKPHRLLNVAHLTHDPTDQRLLAVLCPDGNDDTIVRHEIRPPAGVWRKKRCQLLTAAGSQEIQSGLILKSEVER